MEIKTLAANDMKGHLVKLSHGRLVFLGESPKEPDLFFVAFRNNEGNETKFTLSREAKEALTELLTEKFKGERVSWPLSRTITYRIFQKSNDNEGESNGSN